MYDCLPDLKKLYIQNTRNQKQANVPKHGLLPCMPINPVAIISIAFWISVIY